MADNGTTGILSSSWDDKDLFQDEDELGPLSQESLHFDKDADDDFSLMVDYKVFNDPIHGHILVHPLLVKIIDTPQFQRLRKVKQLGATYFVYPGGSHNRFEHCIGVSYLAEKLARMLQKKQGCLNITDKDVLCVAMAGLCHDLGHGPFSHSFDGLFLPRVRPNCSWTHEVGSCNMLDHLIEENRLQEHLDEYDIKKQDIDFVKEMIAGPLSGKNSEVWPYRGRGEDKSFLYEIVSNERNKVDVDKWDYFARDCHHLGIRNSFDHMRFMQFIKVLRVEGERLQICARDKECLNLYEMFHTRSILHKRAYQHRVASAIDHMICDAFVKADPYIKILGKDGKPCTMSQCIDDPVAYTKLDDGIFDRILHSTEVELQPARDILKRVLKRELYALVGAVKPLEFKISEVPAEIVALDETKVLHVADIIVTAKKINYGMRDRNPIDSFKFFSKSNPTKPYQMRQDDVSSMLPRSFEDTEVQVYCTVVSKIALATKCFENWRKKLNLESNSQVAGLLTPLKRQSQRDACSIGSSKSRKVL